MDILELLPKTCRGHQYILVMVDTTTRYPDASPLRTVTGKTVVKELFLQFSRVGIVEQILKEMSQLTRVTHLRNSIYHPRNDSLVEHLNKTIKSMFCKLIDKDGKDWDQLLYRMFTVREVPQSSTGFAPFEVLYGREPRGLLILAKDTWKQQPSRH